MAPVPNEIEIETVLCKKAKREVNLLKEYKPVYEGKDSFPVRRVLVGMNCDNRDNCIMNADGDYDWTQCPFHQDASAG